MKIYNLKLMPIFFISILSISTLTQAKVNSLPDICNENGTAIMVIKGVDIGDGYHVDLQYGKQLINAYCDVGDCEVLYDYGIKDIKSKVTLSTIQMEEEENTLTCSVTDIELNPYIP